MMRNLRRLAFCFTGLLCFTVLPGSPPLLRAGPVRIHLADGNRLEVPYCWEEEGHIRFEMPGGVAGIPKQQVLSIEEVVSSSEFDPQAAGGALEAAESMSPQEWALFQKEILQKIPLGESYEPLKPDEITGRLPASREDTVNARSTAHLYGISLHSQGDFSEWVRLKDDGALLAVRNVISTHEDLSNRRVLLTLFDADGNVLQKQPCTVHELDVDRRTLNTLGIRGRLFSVVATITPDPAIRRYEITLLRR